MPNHRMFSNRIANSAKFLQMPAEAQLLYFHMILRADDDGVVEAYPLLKLLGTPADVFKVLVAKQFIKELNEDQVVVIKEWLEHNKIRADRKVNSIYSKLLKDKDIKTLTPKPRSDVKDNSNRLSVDCPRADNGRLKLSKDKLSKDKLNNIAGKPAENKINLLLKEFEIINPTINYGNKTQRKALEEMIKQFSYEKILNTIKYAISIQGAQFAPTITTPYQLKEKMGALLIYYKRESQPKKGMIKSL